MDVNQIFLILAIVLHSNGLSILDIQRRFSEPGQPSIILGAPSYSYHLPPSEPILPGHTLIRPAIGMLKSSIKFPHREQENGSGVYGHIENLGIKFDGKNDRVLYTGFRRSLPQSQYRQTRRRNNPYSYRRRHLEIYPPYKKNKQKIMKLSDSINKVLTIYPAIPHNKKYNVKELRIKSPNRPEKKPLRYIEEKKPTDNVLGLVILINRVKDTDLSDIFRIIKSFRRDQKLKPKEKPVEEPEEKLYVPGTANYGDFGAMESDSENVTNKTAMFWKTKNTFNHIKISPEAPDLNELIPADAADMQREWWFFHQSDFEEFEGSGSK